MYLEMFLTLRDGVDPAAIEAFFAGSELAFREAKAGALLSGEADAFEAAVGEKIDRIEDQDAIVVPEKLSHIVKSIFIMPEVNYN
ncbi:hypothetical protein [Ruegeria arenilitoris]|uniref:hypothetical protein n=1 Tax=Ruegeria arenilitoris TaxID=1173585 RepID=UPI00147E6495|nr:hypothetical protein [Ruegeria arenilitoris]